MGVRYRSEFYSYNSVEWKIDLSDSDYSSTVNTFNVYGEGFSLSYNGDIDNPLKAIIGSQVNINAIVEDADFNTYMTDLLGADEERFSCEIYRNSSLYWVGWIIMESIVEQDLNYTHKYKITLNAVDGLGRLKDIDYDNDGTLYSGDERLSNHIINCLAKINLSGNWGVDDVYLTEGINWYDTYHNDTYSDSPLYLTKCEHEAFQTTDDYGNIVGLSCYTVLENILNVFNARILHTRGRYYVVQPSEYADGTTNLRTFKKGGSGHSSLSNVDVSIDDHTRLGGGVFSTLPTIHDAWTTYYYKQGATAGNLLPNPYTLSDSVSLGDIQGGDGEKLSFNGVIYIEFEWNGSDIDDIFHINVFKLTLQVGSKYLTNKNGYLEWSDTITDYYEHVTVKQHQKTYSIPIPFGFVTPEIPASGAGTFEYQFHQYWDHSNNDITGDFTSRVPAHTWSAECQGFTMNLYLGDNEIEEGVVKFKSINTTDGSTPVNSKSEIELPEVWLGDGVNTYSSGRLQVTNGSLWQNASGWDIGTGGSYDINQLRVRDCIALYRDAIRRYEGRIYEAASYYPYRVIEIDSEQYMPLKATFNANSDQWQGNWMRVKVDRTNISDNSTEEEIKEDSSISHSYIIEEIITTISSLANQGVESLTADSATSVVFDVEFPDVNYTLNSLWAYTSSGRVIPVNIENKATTGFDVTAREDCTYEWIAIKL